MDDVKPHQQINQDSGNGEFYTPAIIIEAARRTMGRIDLDPASSLIANRVVMAQRIFTIDDDGLSQSWSGRVWMNHPFGKFVNGAWIKKLTDSFRGGDVSEACCITYASTSEKWFQPLIAFPQCFFFKRTNYLRPDGTVKTGVTKGSAVTYMGPNVNRFVESFKTQGTIKIAASLN